MLKFRFDRHIIKTARPLELLPRRPVPYKISKASQPDFTVFFFLHSNADFYRLKQKQNRELINLADETSLFTAFERTPLTF